MTKGAPPPRAGGDDVRFAHLAAGTQYSAIFQTLGALFLLREGKEISQSQSYVSAGLTSTFHLEFWQIMTICCDARIGERTYRQNRAFRRCFILKNALRLKILFCPVFQ